MARRITILGMGPTAFERRLDIARYVAGTEVWGMNCGFDTFPGFTDWARWYEVHDLDYLMDWDWRKGAKPGLPYFRELDKLGIPVYVTDVLPICKNQMPFPELDMACHFGMNYWDGTPTRMFAHALYEHDQGQEIELIQSFGIDMLDPGHAGQLPYWAHWIARASDRRIRMGGTALDRLNIPETDDGTRVLRPRIGAQMNERMANEQAPGRTDFTVCTAHTIDAHYTAMAGRLRDQCALAGIGFYASELAEGTDRIEILGRVSRALPEALRNGTSNDKPAVWIDADDEVLKAPTLPREDVCWGIGFVANPEAKVRRTACAWSTVIAFNANDAGRRGLLLFSNLINAGMFGHRAVNALHAATVGLAEYAVCDVSRHFAGCLRINPGEYRPQACHT